MPGQHDVEDDEIDRLLRARRPARRRPTPTTCAVQPGLLEVMRDQVGDVAVVFGDEDRSCQLDASAIIPGRLIGSRTALNDLDRSAPR